MPSPIPSYVFDEHNEAFYFWHKARYEGYLTKPLDIYHVDAHSDMAELQMLTRSLYWTDSCKDDYLGHHREIACQELGIDNFIIPAVLGDLIRNVYFVYPSWRKYKRRRSRESVTTAFGEGKVFKHGVKMSPSDKDKMAIAYPDLTQYSYIRTDIEGIPAKRKVILDIDLDYFACTDSITNSMSYRLAITEDQYRNQEAFREENKSLQYSGLEIDFEQNGQGRFAIVRFKKEAEQNYFPTESEIKRETDRLVEVLTEKKIRPVVITICRSCISGYCPPGYFEMIEEYLLQRLQASFPTISLSS